jgi:hypothetical protein
MNKTHSISISFRCSEDVQAILTQLATQLGRTESAACRWAIQYAASNLTARDAAITSDHERRACILGQDTPERICALARLTLLLEQHDAGRPTLNAD